MSKKNKQNHPKNGTGAKTGRPQESAGRQIFLHMAEAATSIYVFFILCIYPLYYHDNYSDMGVSKYAFFSRVSAGLLGIVTIAVIGLAVSWISGVIRAGKKPADELKSILRSLSVCDLFVIAYAVLCVLSYLLSAFHAVPARSDGVLYDLAMDGYSGWSMGLISQLLFVVIYFYVSRHWNWSPFTLIAAAVAAAIAYQIGILQRFGFNPLGMYDNLGPAEIEKFLSTLGQSSWYTSYAILIVPLGLYFYSEAKSLHTRILSGFFIALSFGMIGTSNSDSAYFAIVLIYMVFFCYALRENAAFLRFLESAMIGAGSFLCIGILRKVFPERSIELITGEERITNFVTTSWVMWVLLVLLAVMYAALRYFGNAKTVSFQIGKYKGLIWRVVLTAAVLSVWLVMLLIILTTRRKLPGFLSGLYEIEFMNFNEAWGNHRGFNWRMAFRALQRADIKDMLIGTGPDTFAGAMDTYCYEEVLAYWHGTQLACAHNEWLNMLVTGGILGLAAYFGIFASAFRRGLTIAEREPAVVPFMAAVAAYIGHNVFCYQQCVCTPLIFIMMGIIEMIGRTKGKSEG